MQLMSMHVSEKRKNTWHILSYCLQHYQRQQLTPVHRIVQMYVPSVPPVPAARRAGGPDRSPRGSAASGTPVEKPVDLSIVNGRRRRDRRSTAAVVVVMVVVVSSSPPRLHCCFCCERRENNV